MDTSDLNLFLLAVIARTREYSDVAFSPGHYDQQNFVHITAMACGWAPAGGCAASLATLEESDLKPGQRTYVPEIRQRAQALHSAVAALESAGADHDRLAAAGRTVIESLPRDNSGISIDKDLWLTVYQGVLVRTEQLLAAQPTAVRQDLFDMLTVPAAEFQVRDRLLVAVMSAGGIDGSAWLDRLGDHTYLRFKGMRPIRRWTGEIIRAGGPDGRAHPAALATWRRSVLEECVSSEGDAEFRMWPTPNVGEPWADCVFSDIEAMPGEARTAWQALLAHCAGEKTRARPAARWLKTGGALLDAVGVDAFTDRFDDWISLVGLDRSLPLRGSWECCERHFTEEPQHAMDRVNVGLLVGLLWIRATCPPSEDLVRGLATVAERATRKVPGVGPASPKLANQAATLLADSDHPAALQQLVRLAEALDYQRTLNIVEDGLNKRAAELGVTRDELEETARAEGA
ncbi:hypothetical protein Asp14428_17860 [Actinoplanes sp. NBRC 14428]|uniref:Uncharacterized protein n=1 Tax=Pseudosporangium ferrugineum TaxID=439699 RepID=A0A2T0SBF4_9ACTN|nr:hypothetical protein [Pseudosporangium ferrugineum]PRY30757.1 hypothetical protein CLV70_104309 [Pseudosporangium ferrugineum]BCJ50311.1 hypothetical protein Asp14428_17860 [Actinoplanes sp. NBRC 14428]